MKKRSSNEKILIKQIISFAVYLVLVVLTISILIGLINGNKKALFGYTARVVVSGSMEPSIKVNSINIIKLCSIEDIRVNDVVCFNYSQDIIHRVIEIKTNEDGDIILHTKGDANEKADGVEVYDKMVIGKVVKTFNGVSGFISRYSISPGKIDSLALSRDIIYRLTVFGIIVFGLAYIIEIVVLLIKVLSKHSNASAIEIYKEDINELRMYEELLNELKECEVENTAETRFRFISNSIARAKAEFEMDRLHSSIRHFKKQVKYSMWLNKLGIKIDSTDKYYNKTAENKES